MSEWRTDEARRVFAAPGWARWLDELRWKCAQSSDGRPRGSVELERVTDEERDALGGFLGTYAPPPAPVRLPIRAFERRLLEDRFAPSLLELFLALDGRPLRTRGDKVQAAEEGWTAMFAAVREQAGEPLTPESASWLEELERRTARGARTLRLLYRKQPGQALTALAHAVRALDGQLRRRSESGVAPAGETRQAEGATDEASGSSRQPGETSKSALPLPIVAARITGDAHGLDWSEPAGRLLWFGLEHFCGKGCWSDGEPPLAQDERVFSLEHEDGGVTRTGTDEAKAAASGVEADELSFGSDEPEEETIGTESEFSHRAAYIRGIYRLAGIADDDLSSTVLVFAPSRNAVAAQEERVLTLRQVERLREPLADGNVYAVENPSIFAYLMAASSRMDRAPLPQHRRMPLLVCVSGQPSTAAIALLRLCLADGERMLYYAGDFDLKGLEIAALHAQLFPRAFVPWRMGAGDYERHADRGIVMAEEERSRFAGFVCSWDDQLPKSFVRLGRKTHQELLAESLLEDWLAEMS